MAKSPIFTTLDSVNGALRSQEHPALKLTDAEDTAGVTPANYAFRPGDIRRYGASTGAADNSTAINQALTLSGNGGPAAYIPEGTWRYTSTLNAVLTSSMVGEGQRSVLAPSGCDGITFTDQGTFYGSRTFRDFAITGTSVGDKKGMVALMTAASGSQMNGVQFQSISITGGFQYAVYGYGWNRTTWTGCYFLNNTNGFWFVERSIKVALRDCMVIKSPIATHGDGSIALHVGALSGVRPENVTATGCFFYGHDIGVDFENALYTALDNCDVDQTPSTCVQLTTVNGGCRVVNCWLDTNAAAATTGILVNALGAANGDAILLDGNYIICTQAHASSVGISVGGNQIAVTVNSNTVGSSSAPFATGISLTGSNSVAKFNSIYASTSAVSVNSSSSNVSVGPNTVQNGAPLVFTSLTAAGFGYTASGTFTATLTGMTGATTGQVSWRADNGIVSLSIPDAGITGTSNTTAMTLTGLPQSLWPISTQDTIAMVVDNGAAKVGFASISPSTGVVAFANGMSGTAFTGSGTKGLQGCQIQYAYA